MLETWNLFEIAWSLVALVGLHYSRLNIKNGIEDLLALRSIDPTIQISSDSIFRKMFKIIIRDILNQDIKIGTIIAVGNIRRDSLRFIIQSIFLAVGLLAGFSANIERTGMAAVLYVLGSLVFVLASSLLTISARYDNRDRKLLLGTATVADEDSKNR